MEACCTTAARTGETLNKTGNPSRRVEHEQAWSWWACPSGKTDAMGGAEFEQNCMLMEKVTAVVQMRWYLPRCHRARHLGETPKNDDGEEF